MKEHQHKTRKNSSGEHKVTSQSTYETYQAWPGMPQDQLEELLIACFISGPQNHETEANLKVEAP